MRPLFHWLVDNNNPRSLASWMRRRRGLLLRSVVEQIVRDKEICSIIDLGGTPSYWLMLNWPEDLLKRLRITLVNIEAIAPSANDLGIFVSVTADATQRTTIPDRHYDLCHSNSVIEHVGGWDEKCKFAAEATRLGEVYFVQTPNYWFPVEPHLFFPVIHWLPKPWQVFIVSRFAVG